MGLKKTILKVLSKYCSFAGVHGFQYLTTDWSRTERIVWLIFMTASFVISGITLNDMFYDWNVNPVQTTIETTKMLASRLPFPTITICSPQIDAIGFQKRMFELVDLDKSDSREFFKSEIQSGWKNVESYIDGFVKGRPYSELIERYSYFQMDFPKSSFGVYVAYWIGIHNSTILSQTTRKYIDKYARNPFVPNNIEAVFEKEINPDLQELVKKSGISCPECDTRASNWTNIASILTADLRKSNNSESLEIAFRFRLKLQILFSAAMPYLGPIIAESMIDVESPATKEVFNALSKMTTSSYPPEMVEILTFEVEDYRGEVQKIETFSSNDQKLLECRGSRNSTHLNSSCCSSYRTCALGSYESIYQVMKESHNKPHFNRLISPYKKDKSHIQEARETLISQTLSEFRLTLKNSSFVSEKNQFPFIPLCKIFGKWGTEYPVQYQNAYTTWCEAFQPVFTDEGICFAYNSQHPEEYTKSSPNLEAFSRVYGGKKVDFKPKFITGVGANTGFTIVLDSYSSFDPSKKKRIHQTYFKGVVDNYKNFPLFVHDKIDIRTGEKTILVVTPRILESQKEVRDLPLSVRKCRFSDEVHNSSIFTYYSHSSCIFECYINMGKDMCNCTPWMYPLARTVEEVCDFDGHLCFSNYVLDVVTNYGPKNCSCHPECSEVAYDTQIVKQPFNTAHECLSTLENRELLLYVGKTKKIYESLDFWTYLNNITNQSYLMDSVYDVACETRLGHDIAVVEVVIKSAFVFKYKQNIRLTLSDKISNIGGALGIFWGASLLSFLEMFVWLWKLLIEIVKSEIQVSESINET